ncbi:MAG: tRNA-intron lyase [Candidatus Nanoarchaeia archaeon]|nr:tRNA-intron lyase [Candidatus Haiyanarchaeum thermophilum]MCW1302982.1 tRNA-intron lyase [Candidatus Haiyanarchaeum thermophilum]MCW1303659.1 tRNA-intron lyase [Candidatus Haiyanarchaeum thermophilum]MCW1306340.1 tRNA-intron lyase [Candidatus Haiyanarchaeum thermophilum]MCW1307150.1 tRNA-intron lyase [Candidatus Haiyanarchaeum thermophilum]
MQEKKIKGIILGNKVIVEEKEDASALYNKGCYGKIINDRNELSFVEALYLMEKGFLEVYHDSKKLDFKQFVSIAQSFDPRFWIKFCGYREIRSRGYIVKTALKFGADFLVYDRGIRPGEGHSKWAAFFVSEEESFDWKRFAAMMRVAHGARKKLLVGIVDDEGDVTYYEISWLRP